MNRRKIKWPAVMAVAVALFVPLLIAFFILAANQDSDLTRGSVTSVTLLYGDQTQVVEEKSEIQFFISAATEGSAIEKSAHALEEYRKLEVTYHKLNNDLTYQFYLSDSENDCVYTDPEGKLFLFSASDAKTLQSHPLLGEYALSFASYPSLTVEQQGKVYKPEKISGEWNYIKADGTFSTEKINVAAEEKAVLPQGEKLNLKFEIEPDYCSVLLEDNKGEILYSGVYGEMPSLQLVKDTALSLTVSCDWYESEKKEYHGSLKFSFDLFYDIPTRCTFQSTSALPGQAFVFTVSYSTSPDIAVSATFPTGAISVVKEGDDFAVTVPVSDTANAGEFSILVVGSDVDLTFPVTILQP